MSVACARPWPSVLCVAVRCATLACLLAAPAGAEGLPHGLDPSKALTQLGLDVWTTEHGLPSATVTAVRQTRDGYVWLATYDGLARFDGTRFTVFTQADGLGNNGLRALCEDREGSLWIGTNGGGVSRMSRGRFRRLTTADGLPSDIVWSLHADIRDGSVWMGTNGGGLARWREGKIERFDPKASGRTVAAIAQSPDGTVWLATQADGLRRLAPDGTFTTYTSADGLPGGLVAGVAVGADGVVWVATSAGLVLLRDGRVAPLPAGLEPLRAGLLSSVVEDARGTLWVGTNGSGLARFASGRVSFLGSRDGVGDVVYALHVDGDGRLWIGTNGAGVSRLRDGRFTAYTAREGLARDFAYATFEDRDGTFWVGSAGGLDRLEGSSFVNASPPFERPVAVRSIAQGPDGALWIGTYGAGVWRRRDGRWQGFTAHDGLAHDTVRAVLADRSGRVWAATNGGLSLFEDGKWRSFRESEGLPSHSLIGLAEDRDGSLWVGSDGAGLTRCSQGLFRTFTSKDGLASDVILALRVDPEGTLWVATNGGLSRWADGRFETFSSATGLPSDSVTQVVEDARGDVWVGTSRGVSRVSRASLEAAASDPKRPLALESFDQFDGMKSSQCTAPGQPSAFRSRDGRLWFATTRGVATVDPARPALDLRPASAVIEEVDLDGRPVPFDDGVEVPAGAARVTILFARFSPLAPQRTAVRFRLEGFDAGWVDAGDRRRAEYTNVSPGSYAFRIAARTGMGEWNESGARLAVRVRPRFYQTVPFALAAAAAVVGLLAGGYRLRVRALAARERELSRLVEERTRDLAAQKARAEAAHAQAARLLAEQERVEAELRRNGSYLASLHETALAIMDRLETGPLLESLVERAAALHGAADGFLYLETADGSRLERRVWTGNRPRDEFVGRGEGAVGWTWEYGTPLLVDDYDAWPDRLPNVPAGVFGALLTVPLRFGGRVGGVLGVVHGREKKGVSQAETRLLESFGQLASVALDNARLFERERTARETAERLQAATRALSSTVERDEVIDLILVELEKVVPCDAVAIQELRDGRLELIAGRGLAAGAVGRSFDPASGDGRSAEVLEGRRPIIRDRVTEAPPGAPFKGVLGRSWMGVPLVFGDRIIGMLSLNKEESGFYDEAHAGSAAAFAAQAAVAIENARLFGALQDELAERARAQQELAESELRFRQLAENIDALFFIRSVEPARFLYVSPGFEKIWGRPASIGWKEFLETIHPDDRDSLLAAIARQRDGYDLEYRILRPDGSVRWIRSRAFPIPDEAGRVLRVAGIAEDVTARRSVEQMREDLVRTLVHDLKNPLASMLASMDLLEAALAGPESSAKAEIVRIARRGGIKLRSLVDAILDVARLEQGAMPLALEPVSLAEAVEEALELQRPLAEPRKLQLQNEVGPGLPHLLADRGLLSRILQNLVGNAIKFSPERGRIRVGASREAGGLLRVTVADDGPGLPPDLRERVFERFVTGSHAASGSGLGLAFCRLAVEAQGGRIRVESAPGGGAFFAFTLPEARELPS